MKIVLTPLGRVHHSVNELVSNVLARTFKSEVTVHSELSIPGECVDSLRGQVRADCLTMWLMSRMHRESVDYDIALGIADVDGYIPGLNFVFGVAFPSLKTATVYLTRLRYGVSKDRESYTKFLERVIKEVMHELGHLLGLRHCSNPRCVMHFSNSIFDTDMKSWRFCSRCFRELVARGVYVGSEAVLDS
ncbi:MAG: hypothetical protein DRO09_02570 [Thermoprotei archaeon]|nr:MAG: hypothetical protein DRO09_02570 [Thermoprotei archaeon]